jgi:hypothetical protein
MVLLGENTFVKRSCKQTREIIARRIRSVQVQVEQLRQAHAGLDLGFHGPKKVPAAASSSSGVESKNDSVASTSSSQLPVGLTRQGGKNEEGDDMIDIREEYHESDEEQQTPAAPTTSQRQPAPVKQVSWSDALALAEQALSASEHKAAVTTTTTTTAAAGEVEVEEPSLADFMSALQATSTATGKPPQLEAPQPVVEKKIKPAHNPIGRVQERNPNAVQQPSVSSVSPRAPQAAAPAVQVAPVKKLSKFKQRQLEKRRQQQAQQQNR